MDENYGSSGEQIENLGEHVRELTADKVNLELIFELIKRTSTISGLDTIIDCILQYVANTTGGENVILYYKIDDALFYSDVHGKKTSITHLHDPLVNNVFETGEPLDSVVSTNGTPTQSAQVPRRYDRAIPLQFQFQTTGVLKMENLPDSGFELTHQLPIFFNTVSLMLNKEIVEHLRVKKIKTQLDEAKIALLNYKSEIENRVAERTSGLRLTNNLLQQELIERTSVEEALVEQYSTMQSILENTNSLIYSVDKHYRYTSFNAAHAKVIKAQSGADIELGHCMLDYLFATEDRDKMKENLDRALEGEMFIDEVSSGSEIRSKLYSEVSYHPIRTESCNIVGVVVRSIDISERKRAEEALRESEERWRRLIENNPACIAVHSEGKLVYINASGLRLFNLPNLDQAVGKPVLSFVHPDSREKVISRIKIMMETDKPVMPIEEKYVGWNGESIDVEVTAIPITYMDKPAILTVNWDITKRKQAEEALKESEQRLSDIIDFLPDATFAIDAEGKVIAWNQAIEEMTGVSAKQILGKGDYEYAIPFYGTRRPILIDLILRPDEDIEQLYHYVKRDDDVLLTEADVPIKGGENRFIWAKAVPLKDRNDNIVGAIEAIRDITDRRRAEEALRHERMLLSQIMETSPVGITLVNRDGQITFANQQAVKVLGLTKNEITQRSYNSPEWHITDYEGQPIPSEALPFNQVIITGEPVYGMQHMIRWPNERQVCVSINGAPLLDGFGGIDGVVLTLEDITERRLDLEALRKRKEELERLEKLVISRELKMIELKKQIAGMENKTVNGMEMHHECQ